MGKILLEATNLVKYFGDRKLFTLERFILNAGDKIGIIGANGSGKTTLLQILSGALSPDEGTVRRFSEIATIRQFAGSDDGDGADRRELKQLGVANLQNRQSVSGGEAMRLRIAAAFSQNPPLLFADEPTSNLDADGVRLFCEKMEQAESFLLISHDRAVLNRLCNQILAIENGEIRLYSGNFSAYKEQSEQAFARAEFEYEQYREEEHRLNQSLLEREHKSKKMRKAPARMGNSEARLHKRAATEKEEKVNNARKALESRLERLEVKEKPKKSPMVRFDFALTAPPENKIVIRGERISFAYGRQILLDGASFEVENGGKTVLIGANGSGKTTLLNLIEQQQAGISVVPRGKIGYFRQQFETLDLEKTVLQNAMEGAVQSESTMRNLLARLLIRRDDVFKKTAVLSGGERIKLSFAKLFGSDANILLLDEPTNFLDMPSIEALQQVLAEYEGTVLLVSHDRMFVDAVADRILSLENGKLVAFQGNLSAYEKQKQQPKKVNMDKTVLEIRLAAVISRLSSPNVPNREQLEAEYQELLALKRGL